MAKMINGVKVRTEHRAINAESKEEAFKVMCEEIGSKIDLHGDIYIQLEDEELRQMLEEKFGDKIHFVSEDEVKDVVTGEPTDKLRDALDKAFDEIRGMTEEELKAQESIRNFHIMDIPGADICADYESTCKRAAIEAIESTADDESIAKELIARLNDAKEPAVTVFKTSGIGDEIASFPTFSFMYVISSMLKKHMSILAETKTKKEYDIAMAKIASVFEDVINGCDD